MSRTLTGLVPLGVLFSFLLAVAGCGSSDAPADAGIVSDGGGMRDGAVVDARSPGDAGPAPVDAARDARAPIDGASDARVDGGLAVDAAPDAALGPTGLALLREGWCMPLARASCTAPWDCACPVGGEPRPEPLETCVREVADRCIEDLGSGVLSYLSTGRLRVDEEVLAECTRRIDASFGACSTSKPDLRAYCLGMLVETIAIGEGCVWSESVCAAGIGSCISGACEVRPTRGESCADFGVCAAGLVCREASCVDPSAAGEPCTADSQCEADLTCTGSVCIASLVAIGGACTATDECVAGASCEREVCVAVPAASLCLDEAACPSHASCEMVEGNLCRPKVGEGEHCGSTRDCLEGLFCDHEMLGICQPQRGVGAVCYGDTCERGTFCLHTSGTGMCAPIGGASDPCDAFATPGTDGCVEGLACIRATCATAPGETEYCADDQECAPGLACRNSGELRCALPAIEGEPCSSFGERNECAEGLYCDGGSNQCTARRGAGESCNSWTYECQIGLDCIYDVAGGLATCQTIPTEGAPCSSACAEGLSCQYGPIGGVCSPEVCNDIPYRDRRIDR
jgi:hypothetical protein